MMRRSREIRESRVHSGGFENALQETTTCESQDAGLEAACWCAKICDDYRGLNTVVLDLRHITTEFDYFVITTGNSRRQMHAIAEEVDRMQSEHGERRLGIEGYDRSHWIVQDYGNVVLHVFTQATRELYDLENLWADAVPVDWRAVMAEVHVA
jgi:ribosome-associated protein